MDALGRKLLSVFVNDFSQKLSFSKGQRQQTDLETIARFIPGCVRVEVASVAMDKLGVDYIAYLQGGASLMVDAKTREPGCRKYWKNEVELAVEIWSVRPGGKYHMPAERAKPGWTICDKKNTDLILYTFDASDTHECFLIGFQHLRMALLRYHDSWKRLFKTKIQDSSRWESEAIFVPVSTVLHDISRISRMSISA